VIRWRVCRDLSLSCTRHEFSGIIASLKEVSESTNNDKFL
jgi:hypothetical protein